MKHYKLLMNTLMILNISPAELMLCVNKFQGNNTSACIIDISGIDNLKKVEKNDSYLKIGALVKLDNLHNMKTYAASFLRW